jgi:predicted DNA-binding protein
MPTTKKRLNITIDNDMDKHLRMLAEQANVPQATVTTRLLRDALEFEEDLRLGHIAEQRASDGSKYILNKDEFWK